MFDWDRAFIKTNVSEKVLILNKTILNILSNYVPHEILTVDDPSWFTKKKKNSSKRKTIFINAIEIVKVTTTYIEIEIECCTRRPT